MVYALFEIIGGSLEGAVEQAKTIKKARRAILASREERDRQDKEYAEVSYFLGKLISPQSERCSLLLFHFGLCPEVEPNSQSHPSVCPCVLESLHPGSVLGHGEYQEFKELLCMAFDVKVVKLYVSHKESFLFASYLLWLL